MAGRRRCFEGLVYCLQRLVGIPHFGESVAIAGMALDRSRFLQGFSNIQCLSKPQAGCLTRCPHRPAIPYQGCRALGSGPLGDFGLECFLGLRIHPYRRHRAEGKQAVYTAGSVSAGVAEAVSFRSFPKLARFQARTDRCSHSPFP